MISIYTVNVYIFSYTLSQNLESLILIKSRMQDNLGVRTNGVVVQSIGYTKLCHLFSFIANKYAKAKFQL
jgi:hypothetical protein